MSIFSKKTVWFFILFTISLFVYTLWGREIHVDDGWLTEYSFYLKKLGYVKSEGMKGWLGAESRLFMYPKMFTYIGALWGALVGFGAYESKAMSLVFLGIAIYFLYKVYRQQSSSKLNAILVVCLFLSFFHTALLSFTYRPEVMVVASALGGFYFLNKFLNEGHWGYLVVAGFLSGLCITMHLNGVIVVGASVLLLWTEKRIKEGFLLGVIGSWGLLFFFADIRSWNDFELLQLQFRGARDLSDSHFTVLHYLYNLVYEQARYFHSIPEILYTSLLLTTAFIGRKVYKVKDSRSLLFALYISLLLGLVAHGKTAKYLLYASPFYFVWVIKTIEDFYQNKSSKKGRVALIVFMVFSWIYNIHYFSKKEVLLWEAQKIVSLLPENSGILGGTYWFYATQGKLDLQWFVNYDDAVRAGDIPLGLRSLTEWAKVNGKDFIALEEELLDSYQLETESLNEYNFVELPFETQFIVFDLRDE